PEVGGAGRSVSGCIAIQTASDALYCGTFTGDGCAPEARAGVLYPYLSRSAARSDQCGFTGQREAFIRRHEAGIRDLRRCWRRAFNRKGRKEKAPSTQTKPDADISQD